MFSTKMLTDACACWNVSSVAVKVIVYEPACAGVGVQVKVLLTGGAIALPSGGFIVAPCGNPPLLSVTLAFGSESFPVTVNVTCVFGRTENGPGGLIVIVGGLPLDPDPILKKKSSGVFDLTLLFASRSSTMIWAV